MKTLIKDSVQILVAFLITGSMVFASELPQAPTPVQASINSEVAAKPEPVTPVATQPATPTAPVAEVAASQPTPTPVAAPIVAPAPTYVPSGNQADWLLASGIPQQYWRAVDYIVSRESGWRPCAYYPARNDCSASPSTACGLVMQNPCGKIGGDWRDPVAALKWADGYVNAKYGGWPGAQQYWMANGNY